MTTHEEIQSAHKKALKSLDGEKRAAIKKAKALKGKKGKDALAALEDDFATKLKTLESNLEKDLAALEMVDTDQKGDDGGHDNNGENSGQSEAKADDSEPVSETAAPLQVFDEEAVARERKLAKSRKKRENQRKKEAEMEQKIAEETANAGPSMRDIELGQIQAVLSPLNLAISEVKADGHCLYRSVAAQLTTIAPDSNQLDYSNIRALCADTLQAHQEEFAPFCEYDGQITNFDQVSVNISYLSNDMILAVEASLPPTVLPKL